MLIIELILSDCWIDFIYQFLVFDEVNISLISVYSKQSFSVTYQIIIFFCILTHGRQLFRGINSQHWNKLLNHLIILWFYNVPHFLDRLDGNQSRFFTVAFFTLAFQLSNSPSLFTFFSCCLGKIINQKYDTSTVVALEFIFYQWFKNERIWIYEWKPLKIWS